MSTKKIHFLSPLKALRRRKGLSERDAATQSKLARLSIRNTEEGRSNLSLDTIASLANTLDREISILACSDSCPSEFSTACISMKVKQDGFESWKIHFFDFVDEFRRHLNPQLLILPPIESLDKIAKAMLASICLELCNEAGMDAPAWAQKSYNLEQPYFPSQSESLKASAILESPPNFRKNNIFVLNNFLRRA